MPTTLANLIDLTELHVPDMLGEIVESQREQAVTEGLLRFSADAPFVICTSGITSQQINASGALSGWEPNYSKVVEVEWPVLDTNVVRLTSKKADVFVGTSQEDTIRFIDAFPSVSSPASIRYTSIYEPTTLPDAFTYIVGLKAAVCLCAIKEAVYTSAHDVEFGEQTIQSAKEQADAFKTLGETLEAKYQELLTGL